MSASQQGKRLLTQNLLVSASAYEGTAALSWAAIHDLCALIDLFCLYDEFWILGRQAYSMYPLDGSDYWSALRSIVRVDDFQGDPRIIEAACGHLGAYVGETEESKKFEPLFETVLSPDSISRAFSRDPDTEYEVATGREWLQTLPPGTDLVTQLVREENVHRGATFVARTFLYLAYADAHRIPLTSDTTRAPILEAAVKTERNLRKQLLEKLNEQSKDGLLTDDFGDLEITRQVTPLASVVFDRAWPNKEDIPKEMRRLRDELAPIRARIAETEESFLWGSRQDELEAVKKWVKVFDEIERQFGKGESLLKLSGLLGVAEGAAGGYMKPADVKSWFKLIDLPMEIIRRIYARRSVIELHRLRPEIPSSERLRLTVGRLFGDRLR